MDKEHKSELAPAVKEMSTVLRSTLKHLPEDLIADFAFKFEDLASDELFERCFTSPSRS